MDTISAGTYNRQPTKKERNEMTEATLYDFFDADTDESVLRAYTYSEARIVLGNGLSLTTRSLAVGHYEGMPAEAFTNRISNKTVTTRNRGQN